MLVRQLRRVGVERLLFGLDVAANATQARERWEVVKQLPFTAAELRTIATNLAPYLRR